MGSWTNDSTLVNLMREFVVATNRIRYAQAHPETEHAAVAALRREQVAVAAAFEQALLERGWQIPGTRFPQPRAEAVSF